jgi:hypothetical protein
MQYYSQALELVVNCGIKSQPALEGSWWVHVSILLSLMPKYRVRSEYVVSKYIHKYLPIQVLFHQLSQSIIGPPIVVIIQ